MKGSVDNIWWNDLLMYVQVPLHFSKTRYIKSNILSHDWNINTMQVSFELIYIFMHSFI